MNLLYLSSFRTTSLHLILPYHPTQYTQLFTLSYSTHSLFFFISSVSSILFLLSTCSLYTSSSIRISMNRSHHLHSLTHLYSLPLRLSSYTWHSPSLDYWCSSSLLYFLLYPLLSSLYSSSLPSTTTRRMNRSSYTYSNL